MYNSHKQRKVLRKYWNHSKKQTYPNLDKNPATTIQTYHNDLINNLKDENEIDDHLLIYNPDFPKL